MTSSVPPPIGPSRVSRRAPTELEVAARDPERRLGQLERGPLREQLRLGHLTDRVVAAGEQVEGVVRERARGLELDRQLRHRVTELGPARRGRDRALEHDLHRADRAERHHEPLPLEVGHHELEAPVLLAEEVLLGDEHVVERELGGVGGVPAELLELPRDQEAVHVALDDEEGDAVMAALLGGLHGRDDEVGAHTVRDEGLRPVDHVAAVDRLCARADAGHVRAGARLRDAERADPLASDRRGEEALLLLVRAELPHRRRRDRDVRADARREAP